MRRAQGTDRQFLAPSTFEPRLVAAVASVAFAVALAVGLATGDLPAIALAPVVAVVGVELGMTAGIVGGVVAAVLYGVAADVDLGGALVRAIPFLVLGGLIGWLADRLRASEAAQRRLIETANEGIWIVDPDGRTRFVNRRLTEMLGVEAEDLVGRPVDVPGALERLDRQRRGISEQVDVELRRGDGSPLWARISSSPIVDAKGRFAGSLAMLADITDHRIAELRLEEAQEIAHLGSWTWDVRQDAVTWSRELRRIVGVGEDALVRDYRGFLERVHPDDRERVAATIAHAVQRREPFGFSYRVVRPDGGERTLEASGTVHVDDRGEATRLTGVALDVTERRRAETELAEARLARRQARELNDSVVQSLVLARYAFRRGDGESAARLVETTLDRARRLISDLIGAGDIRPGDLRRETSAGVD